MGKKIQLYFFTGLSPGRDLNLTKKKERTKCTSIIKQPYSYCIQSSEYLISLQNDKILDQSKFKAFADDKINVTKKLKFV